MDQYETALREMSLRQVEMMRVILHDVYSRLDEAIMEYVRRTTNHFAAIVPEQSEYLSFIERRYKHILSLYDKALQTFYSGIGPVLDRTYRFGINIYDQFLLESGINLSGAMVDTKAVSVLIRDAANDFRVAIDQSKTMFRNYYKISKQGFLTESQISEAVAKGLLQTGTPLESKKALIKLFENTKSTSRTSRIFSARDNDTRQFFIDRIGKREFERLEKINSKLLDKKYIQIIDKNGNEINFKLDTYTDLVTRSRITDSQTTAAQEEGQRAGIVFYLVPGHQTTADVCRPHEDQIYTTDKELAAAGVCEYLTPQNKPGYHPRCSHRIFPKVFTNTKLFTFISQKAGIAFATQWFKKNGKSVPDQRVA
ncbi:hypothetical protein [Leptospira alexanderi]|uniref:hypothetical protein n=1 Tax=Leptospira alexanderi TaxID=100053 RepID=UPI000990B6A1|nr:hypothetical protein [Leptospira alexanderi]